MTLAEVALRKYPVRIEEVRDPETYMVVDEVDVNATRRHLFIKFRSEQMNLDKENAYIAFCSTRDCRCGIEICKKHGFCEDFVEFKRKLDTLMEG